MRVGQGTLTAAGATQNAAGVRQAISEFRAASPWTPAAWCPAWCS